MDGEQPNKHACCRWFKMKTCPVEAHSVSHFGCDSQLSSAHISLTETVLHRAAASSILKHEAQSKHSLFLFLIGPKQPPPTTTTFILSLSITLYHCFNLLIWRAAASPGHSASSWLFTFQKLTSEMVFCVSLWGFVLWDSSDARNKGLLDQKRKKDSCCHFHFCITQLAGMVVVSLVLCSLGCFQCLKIDLTPCCWSTAQWFLIDTQIHCLALSRIKLLLFRHLLLEGHVFSPEGAA